MPLLWRLLAPYIAVLPFMLIFQSAWLAMLVYHAQIIFCWFWLKGERPKLRPTRLALLALPAGLAGLLLYYLLPYISRSTLFDWLAAYQLSGWSLVLMLCYFGLLHPLLEQLHWAELREETPWSHAFFAGYHLIVLHTFLSPLALLLCFLLLVIVSLLWGWVTRVSGSLLPSLVSHILADLSIALMVLVMLSRL